MEGATNPMSSIIDMVTPVVTYLFTVCGQVITTIVGSPYLMFTVGFLVLGAAIKFVRSLLRR